MKKLLAFDLPTRLFHWTFVFLFASAFFIAKTIDSDSLNFSYHMLLGMTLSLAVVLRIIWGLIGSRYAKFTSFELGPTKLMGYFLDLFTRKTRLTLHHNPASSWSALVMMLLALGLGITGYLMTTGPEKETFEEIHELFGNGLLIIAILHVVGVAAHTIRHKDLIGLSMITGKKSSDSNQEPISNQHPLVAIIFLMIVVGFSTYAFKSFDTNTRQLSFMGITFNLGESEEGNEGGENGKAEGENDDEDSDDE